MNNIFLQSVTPEAGDKLNFFILGGTEDSIKFSKTESGGEWRFPDNYIGDKNSRIKNSYGLDENSDDEFMHVFVLKDGLKIYQYSPEEETLKTYFQPSKLNSPVVLESVKMTNQKNIEEKFNQDKKDKNHMQPHDKSSQGFFGELKNKRERSNSSEERPNKKFNK